MAVPVIIGTVSQIGDGIQSAALGGLRVRHPVPHGGDAGLLWVGGRAHGADFWASVWTGGRMGCGLGIGLFLAGGILTLGGCG